MKRAEGGGAGWVGRGQEWWGGITIRWVMYGFEKDRFQLDFFSVLRINRFKKDSTNVSCGCSTDRD